MVSADRAGDRRRGRRHHHLPARPRRLQGRHRRGQGRGHRRRLDRLRRPQRRLLGRHRQRGHTAALGRPDQRADRRRGPGRHRRHRPDLAQPGRAGEGLPRAGQGQNYPDIKELAWEGDNSRRRHRRPEDRRAGRRLSRAQLPLDHRRRGARRRPRGAQRGRQAAGRHQGAGGRRPGLHAQGHRGRLDHRDAQPVLVRRLGQYRPADGGDEDLRQQSEAFYEIPVDPVTKDRLPYTGCPPENASKPFGY